MGWRVTLSDPADRDLGNAVAFLAQKNPAAAERLGMDLVATIFSLTEMPHRGTAVSGRPDYRRVLHLPWFVIFYRIEAASRRVVIARIWDARLDPAGFSLG
jgi:plasmid stabilization system protein ParE